MDEKGFFKSCISNLGAGIPKWIKENRNKCIDDRVFYMELLFGTLLFHFPPQ